MSKPTIEELLDVAVDAAYLAGRKTLAYFQTGITAEYKADDTPVTLADREAEKLLRARILASFPDHAILGEEEGETHGDAPYKWIADPIDGTKAFVAGVPLYGTLIGVEHEGRIVAGAIYLPGLDDMVCAGEGKGAYWNGRRCHVSDKSDLSRAVIVCSSITRSQRKSAAFGRLSDATYLQRTWGDAFGYSLVATGRVELMLDPAKSPWDVAPMPVILNEAGGRWSDWSGNPTIYGPDFFACNAALYDQALEILSGE